MRIFHLALRSDWEAARRAGAYTVSTRGRTLAEEGFIHASRGDQWQGVRDRFYADVEEPMVLLVIDTDRLTSPVVEEAPDGAGDTGETFPHVYGPVNADAVVQVVPLDSAGRPSEASFSALFMQELFRNVLLASVLLVAVVVGALVGQALDPEWGPLGGTLVALAVGVPLLVAGRRRWSRPDGS
ncbi:DUF952 domain-containing protein [Nocardioides sp. GCM10027113]|uniref:DUF952 domain-containing protein n=1 Tax=unclassified Nocardioides TaxID=2615069 RepID=UPI003622B55E